MLAAAAGDVDGDGSVDLGRRRRHQRRTSGSTTAPATSAPATAALDVAPTDATVAALGDLDGDGNLDLVAGAGQHHGRRGARVPERQGGQRPLHLHAGALPPAPVRASALAIGDLDNDGDLDVVLGQTGGAVRVYLNRGDAFLDDRSFSLLPDQVSGDVPNLLARRSRRRLPARPGGAARGRRAALVALGRRRHARRRRHASISRSPPPAPAPTTSTATAMLDVLLWGGMTGLQLEVQQ